MAAAVSHQLYPPVSGIPVSNRRHEALFSLLLFVVALILLLVCRSYAPEPVRFWFAAVPFESTLSVLILLAAVISALVLHEGGHLLASLALQFQFLGASFGPLQLQTLHGKWKISFSSKRMLTGSVSAVPINSQHWRTKLLIVVAAGPLATLASAIAAAFFYPRDAFQIAFVQVSILLFVLGLVPNGARANRRNDARLFLDLLLNKEGAEELDLYILLSQQVIAGARPEDYPAELIHRLAAWGGRVESQVVFAQAMAQWALDSEDAVLADAWDLRALTLAQHCNARTNNTVLAASACFDVLYRDDLERARIKFARVDFDALFPKCLEHRARAAQQFALGRLHRAPAEIIRAQYALPRAASPPTTSSVNASHGFT